VALLAVAYEQSKRDTEALAAHRQALALAPHEASALSNLAMFQASHGDTAEAERLLRRAVALPGANATVRQNLALVLGLQGKMAEAEALARQDLPPELADRNLAYLRAASSPAPPSRSWDALRTP
jgi:Flp pilus assembly protein TadD